MSILLNTVEKVKDFVNITSRLQNEVFVKSGRYVIDGKSLMGMFSLDLSKPVELEIGYIEGQNEKEVNDYIAKMKEFSLE